jgi:predicted outer membrane protein
MTNRFMMSVAAVALIAGTSFANAQGTGTGREGPSTGPAAQQSAPSGGSGGSAAPMNRDSAAPAGRESTEPTKPSSGMKATQGEEKMAPNGAKRAQDTAPGQKPNSMSSDKDGKRDMKSEGRDNKAEGRDMKSDGRDNKAEGRDMKSDGHDNKAEGRDMKNEGRDRAQTTGQAGAGAKLSGEQRTRITTVIKQQNIRPVEHVNFAVSIGTRVPRDVGFHPLPAEIVTIYPDWRGYEMFLVGDQIVVVNPRTLEIVAVLDV